MLQTCQFPNGSLDLVQLGVCVCVCVCVCMCERERERERGREYDYFDLGELKEPILKFICKNKYLRLSKTP
jgi:hypothetical protein